MSIGGKVLHHPFAPKTSSSGKANPSYNLVHQYQYQKMPGSELPSLWDIDRSNHPGEGSSQSAEEGWNKSASWNSKFDLLMNQIEHNSGLIYNLSCVVEDLKELVEKFIKDSSPPPPKE
jgi:hypothetical protein